MSDPKDSTSFFRKVVKFVANPTTEWAEIGSPTDESRESDFAKGELKNFGRLERAKKLNALGRRQKLNCNYLSDIFCNLYQLPRRKSRHAHMVFLIR